MRAKVGKSGSVYADQHPETSFVSPQPVWSLEVITNNYCPRCWTHLSISSSDGFEEIPAE